MAMKVGGINMIQLIVLMGLVAPKAPTTAQAQTCQWPHVCKVEATAQVQPCVWPNRCEKPAPVVAQVQTCQWPNRCSASTTL